MIGRLIPRRFGPQMALTAVALLAVVQIGSVALFGWLRPVSLTVFDSAWLVDRLPALAEGAFALPPERRLDWLRARPEAEWLAFARGARPMMPPLGRAAAEASEVGQRLRGLAGDPDGVALSFGPGPVPLSPPPSVARVPPMAEGAEPPRALVPLFRAAIREPEGGWLTIEPHRPFAISPGLTMALAWLGMLFVSAAFVAWLGFRRLSAPLARLADAADRFGRGLPAGELPRGGAREIATIAEQFARMLERISRFVAERTSMLAAVSHDLRTPLTRMRLRVERVGDPELCAALSRDLDALEAIARETLEFARVEGEASPADRVDLASLLQTSVDAHADLGAAVVYEGPPRLTVLGRAGALRRAADNLIDNALRYGTRARVRLVEDEAEIRIEIDDDGPGIPDSERERVFEPFVRLEASRNRDSGGTGLGLTIARNLVRGHGGDVVLGNRPGGGLRATIHLPKST